MDQTNWESFTPVKSDYFELNDQLIDIKAETENDQFLLQQLDHNLYDGVTDGDGDGKHAPKNDALTKLNDFSLDNYNFEDLNHDMSELGYRHGDAPTGGDIAGAGAGAPSTYRHNSSSAFPPTGSVQNTPSMLPHKHQQLVNHNQVVSSPILPSQNDKSFNNQHYYHKLSRNKSKEALESMPQSQHIRPDVIFTPLMSPHHTPADSRGKFAVQASFEPLTSPALAAQTHGPSDAVSKRRSSSSVFSTVNENKPVSFKRRTPHGTPILPSNGSSSGVDGGTHFEGLPDASMSVSSSSTPMLPPQSYKKIDPESSTTSPQMMGFTMGKLAKQKSQPPPPVDSPPTSSRKSSYDSSRSNDTSPSLAPMGKEKPSTKKASHKLAEQGRRNRMNVAVQSLGLLVPQKYHERVAIPSKATTVELASSYIKDLVREVEELKKRS
ncbi:hypothetical protein CANTEDRAFT_134063 [Yamadazyma tenuis ATCC 10573]|uniref:BHLH domain-containing protein n=3 Tax=Candida tenuis TaxID=2315449 RepID=G3B2S6_CANTC|nr:uncharacterized protein CANTEDRAFT_134063 [Yamadazyma tenuis ATCC 10573]EGV64752.1 hypothetical protein CANTEDRAFT_134063 [Yamadazyma tenuis ATCC 10573]